MSEQTYRGYKNYETWSVALIVDNERALYETRREMARFAWDHENVDTYGTHSDKARYSFADSLNEWVTGEVEVGTTSGDGFASLQSQLLGAALSEVDWDEIADNWLNEEINENGEGGYEQDK